MGIFDRFFKGKKQEDNDPTVHVISKKFEIKGDSHTNELTHFVIYKGVLMNNIITAEVPIVVRQKCERLMQKMNRSEEENEYLHENYWITVYYKELRHAYKGTDDLWTYSARELPELPIIHEWIYGVLGKARPMILTIIQTIKIWEEGNVIFADGIYESMKIQLSFKPKGVVLSFLIEDFLRWKEKASYNTKTHEFVFPFYYSKTQFKIVEWANSIYQEKRTIQTKENQ